MIQPTSAIIQATTAATQSKTNFGVIVGLAVPLLVVILGFLIRNRKLTLENNAGLRKEFIEEMGAMRAEMRGMRGENDGLRTEIIGLRGENSDLREEVGKMRRENSQLIEEVRQLHGVIDGMRRDRIAGNISGQRVVIDSLPAESVPPATRAMLDALDRMPD